MIRDGYMNPFDLVVAGWEEKKASGITPDMNELARRINTSFRADIDNFDRFIESAKPKKTDGG